MRATVRTIEPGDGRVVLVVVAHADDMALFLPPDVTFDQLLRAVIGVALFASAYMAEVVRGGLQAIPKGQYEGAMALVGGAGRRSRQRIDMTFNELGLNARMVSRLDSPFFGERLSARKVRLASRWLGEGLEEGIGVRG